MTAGEALKHLERKIKQKVFQVDPEAFEALKIASEALKREIEYRPRKGPRNFDLLPGETEEGG